MEQASRRARHGGDDVLRGRRTRRRSPLADSARADRSRRSQSAAADAIGRAAAGRGGRRGAAHRLREHRQPAAVESRGAAARARGAAGGRREPRAPGAAAADRKRAVVVHRRSRRCWPGVGRRPSRSRRRRRRRARCHSRSTLRSTAGCWRSRSRCRLSPGSCLASLRRSRRRGRAWCRRSRMRRATATDARSRFTLSRTLVVAEVALSLLLLIAAGLFVRSLQSARDDRPGLRCRQARLRAAQHQSPALHARPGPASSTARSSSGSSDCRVSRRRASRASR